MTRSALLVLAALSSVAHADSSPPSQTSDADPLPAACLAQLDGIARRLSLRSYAPTREGRAIDLTWTYSAADCDGDAFSLRVEPRRASPAPWRSRRRGSLLESTRETHGLALTLTAAPVEAPSQRARDFLSLARRALDACLEPE